MTTRDGFTGRGRCRGVHTTYSRPDQMGCRAGVCAIFHNKAGKYYTYNEIHIIHYTKISTLKCCNFNLRYFLSDAVFVIYVNILFQSDSHT